MKKIFDFLFSLNLSFNCSDGESLEGKSLCFTVPLVFIELNNDFLDFFCYLKKVCYTVDIEDKVLSFTYLLSKVSDD